MRKFLFLVLILVLGAAYWYQTKQKTPPAPAATTKATPSKAWTLPFRPPTAAENARAQKIVVRVDKQIDGAALASVCIFHPSHGQINTGATSKENNMSVVESRLGKSEEDWEVTKQQIAIVSHPQAATLVPGRTVAFKGILGQPIAVPGGKTVPSASAFVVVAPGR